MSKWVLITPGHHRYVDDSDSRPPVDLPDKPGVPNLITRPSWATYEKSMHGTDPKTQRDATDAFIHERDNSMKNSPKARNWELSRKREWAKNKPAWRKERAKRDPLISL